MIFGRFVRTFAQPTFRCAAALFVFSLAVNLACFNWTEAPILYPDSHGYIKLSRQLSERHFPDFSMRSPTYPVYLSIMGLFGRIVNRSPLKLAACGQIVFGAITIVLFYLICLKLLKREWLALGVSLLLSLNFEVINYQSTVLTETLSTTLLMAVLYAHTASLGQRLTVKRLAVLVVMDSLLIMLRPNFVLLPTGLYAVQFLSHLPIFSTTPAALCSASSSTLFLILGIVCNVALVATWSAFYYLQTGHLGLTQISDFNLLGKAVQYGYLDRNYADPPPLARRAQEIYYAEGSRSNPNVVIRRLRKENLYTLGNLRSINSYFLAGHEVDFVSKPARLLPDVLNKRPESYYGRRGDLSQSPWLQSITRGFNLLHVLNGAAMVFAFGFSVYLLIRKQRDQFAVLVMILCTAFYHLMTITVFGYTEYSRLRVPIDLLLNLLILLPFSLFALHVTERINIRVSRSVARAT
jgi:hypothetical protein